MPGDQWDYTATQHIQLTTLTIDGQPRKVLMHAPKNGFFYVLDRKTGELLSADPYEDVTWASHIDLKTGRPVFNVARTDYEDGKEKVVFPRQWVLTTGTRCRSARARGSCISPPCTSAPRFVSPRNTARIGRDASTPTSRRALA